VTSDPKRTPTFTMFGDPSFFFTTGNGCKSSSTDPGSAECVDYHFAWNHGDVQDEIGNTWLGFVGPGVENHGIDAKTWTDHTDVRPTINALIGLTDSYASDGRVISEIADQQALPNDLRGGGDRVAQLGAAYKQLNAPFGEFGQQTLVASTTALKSTSDLTYDSIEAQIATLTAQRNGLAGTIRAALNDAAAGRGRIDEGQARNWITKANDLIARANALAAGS